MALQHALSGAACLWGGVGSGCVRALIHLTRAMALELARHRIRVNALAPGYIETGINREFFASEAGRSLIGRIPQRRIGTPGELDAALLLLASDAGSYATGSVVALDGGHLVASL